MRAIATIQSLLAKLASRTLLMSYVVFCIGFGARQSVPLYIDSITPADFIYPAIMVFPCGAVAGVTALAGTLFFSPFIFLLRGSAQSILAILLSACVAGAIYAGGHYQWLVWTARIWEKYLDPEHHGAPIFKLLSLVKSTVQLLLSFKLLTFAIGFIQTLLPFTHLP